MLKGPVWDPPSNEPEFFQHGRGIRKFGDPLHVVCRRAKVGASLVWRKVQDRDLSSHELELLLTMRKLQTGEVLLGYRIKSDQGLRSVFSWSPKPPVGA